jgi:hypothetical protein
VTLRTCAGALLGGPLFLMASLALTTSASADALVLRTGERWEGTILDRDAVLTSAGAQPRIEIRTTLGPVLGFDRGEVAYLAFEDDGRTIEINLTQGVPTPNAPRNLLEQFRDVPDGAKLIYAGMLVGSAGALVRFGERETDESGELVPGGHRSYNVVNGVLMGAGGLMVASGILMCIGEAMDRDSDGPSGTGGLTVRSSPI